MTTDKSSPSAKPVSPGHRWILFVSGPTASGKTTIAKYLADKLKLKFVEGDDFHPKTNIEKMHRGEPLTDQDRKSWLEALRDHASVHPRGPGSEHLVITCSALKRMYRDLLRQGSDEAGDVRIHFLHLDAPEHVLRERAAARKGHFAGPDLVRTQFEALERPTDDEKDVVTISVDQPFDTVQKDALERIEQLLKDEAE